MVMTRPTGPLNPSMTTQVKIVLGRVTNRNINRSPRRNIPTLSSLILPIHTEQPCVMPFLNSHKSNTRHVVFLQTQTSTPDSF